MKAADGFITQADSSVSTWMRTTLEAVTQWSSGGTPKKDVPEFWGGSIPWISANSMHGTRLGDSDLTLTLVGLEAGSRLVEKDTVLLLVRGGALHTRIPVGITTRPVAFNQDVKAIRADPQKIHPWYLLYWLMAQEQYLLESVVEYTGIGAGKLETKRMQSLEMLLPPLEEQLEILTLIKGLDDKISLLRETNATLEAIAQALFKSWFVDFDPVRAKAEGRDPEGVPPEVAELFPCEFEDSDLGVIPKGWRFGALGEVVQILDSKRVPLSGADRAKRPGPYPYYGAAALMDHVDDFLFDGIFLLMGEDGSVTRSDGTPVLQYIWGKFWVNNHAHVLLGKAGIATEHIMLSLQHANISAYVTGAVQAKLNQGNLIRIPFVIPSDSIAALFSEEIDPIFAAFRSNQELSILLSEIRDDLLPRLMSGKVGISVTSSGN